MHRNRVSAGCLLAGVLLLSGCASIKSHWPFGKGAAVAAQPVNELELQVPSGGAAPAVLQYWERNTLVVDLQSVAGSGEVVLARKTGNNWPARIALRMAPQRYETVEVRGAQRLVLPVAAGAEATTAELPPGIYEPGTAALTLRWGAKDAF